MDDVLWWSFVGLLSNELDCPVSSQLPHSLIPFVLQGLAFFFLQEARKFSEVDLPNKNSVETF